MAGNNREPLPKVLGRDLREFINNGLSSEAVGRFNRTGIQTIGELYSALYLKTGVELKGIGPKCIRQGQKLMQKLDLDSRIGIDNIFEVVAAEAAAQTVVDDFEKKIAELLKAHEADIASVNDQLNMTVGDILTLRSREGLLREALAKANGRTLKFRAAGVTPELVKRWLLKGTVEGDLTPITFGAELSYFLAQGFAPFTRTMNMTVGRRDLAKVVLAHERSPGSTSEDHTVIGFLVPDFPTVSKEVFATMRFGNGSLFSNADLQGSVAFGDFTDDDAEALFKGLPELKHQASTGSNCD